MKNYFVLLLLLLSCGCSTTYQINSPADAHTRLENKNGTILLHNGNEYDAESIRVHGDSLTYTSKITKTDSSLFFGDIKRVKRINRGKGAGNGALIGGATVFLPLMWSLSTNSAYHNVEEQNGNFVLSVMLGAATAAGSGIGALIGTGIGVHETLLFNHDTTRQEPAPSESADRDPLRVKHAFKVGIEWGGSFTHESSSYSVLPGYSFGFMTGMNLYRASYGAFHLGTEISLLRMNEYFPREEKTWSGYLQYRTLYDIKDQYSLLEMALLPEFSISLGESLTGSVYAGMGFTLSGKETRTTMISRVVTDSGYYHFPDYLSSPPPIGNPGIYSTGVRFYLKRLMLDLRYRRMTVSGVGEYDHFFAEVGFVL